jgi:hypothetical protein
MRDTTTLLNFLLAAIINKNKLMTIKQNSIKCPERKRAVDLTTVSHSVENNVLPAFTKKVEGVMVPK